MVFEKTLPSLPQHRVSIQKVTTRNSVIFRCAPQAEYLLPFEIHFSERLCYYFQVQCVMTDYLSTMLPWIKIKEKTLPIVFKSVWLWITDDCVMTWFYLFFFLNVTWLRWHRSVIPHDQYKNGFETVNELPCVSFFIASCWNKDSRLNKVLITHYTRVWQVLSWNRKKINWKRLLQNKPYCTKYSCNNAAHHLLCNISLKYVEFN